MGLCCQKILSNAVIGFHVSSAFGNKHGFGIFHVAGSITPFKTPGNY
jgi:hypothetical protein